MGNPLLALHQADTVVSPPTWAAGLERVCVTTRGQRPEFTLGDWVGGGMPGAGGAGRDEGGSGSSDSELTLGGVQVRGGCGEEVRKEEEKQEEQKQEEGGQVLDAAAVAAASAAAHATTAQAMAQVARQTVAAVHTPVIKAGLTRWLQAVRSRLAGTALTEHRLRWRAVCGFAAGHGVWLHRLCGGSAKACAYLQVFLGEVCPAHVRAGVGRGGSMPSPHQ